MLGGAAGLALVALLGFGLSRDARNLPSPLIGNPAPLFELETLDGDTVRLADYGGDVVLVNFWASWCLACEEEHPLLVWVDEQFNDQGVHVVGIVYQDTRENARRWVAERGGAWQNGLDRGSRTAIDYGVRGVPETFFIARDGSVVFRQIGPISTNLVAALLPPLIADSGLTLSPEERTGRSEGWTQPSPENPPMQGTPEKR